MDGMIGRRNPASALAREFAESAVRYDREGQFPTEHFNRLRDEHLLALTLPKAWGGAGAGLADIIGMVGTIAEACPSTALILSMQLLHLKAMARNPRWPEHLVRQVSDNAVTKGGLINALRVEPALGSPARGGLPETIARKVSRGWAINGHKIYSTGAPGLTWMLVFARTDEPTPRVGPFLVPATTPGIEIVETWDQLGLRASASHDVLLRDVIVPEDHAVDLRLPEGWLRADVDHAAWNNLTIAALYTGVARAARDWLVKFLNERAPANLGAPLATLPRMQEAVGGIEALLLANDRMITSAAAEYDAERILSTSDYGLIKTLSAEHAIRAVEEAMALTGNHGLSRLNPLERHLRNVLCARIHTPQADSAKIAAGRAALMQQKL